MLTLGDLIWVLLFGALGSLLGMVFGVFALALWHEARAQIEAWTRRRQRPRMPRVLQPDQHWRGL